MGLNTALIIRNDFLHDIKDDPQFGHKVATAIAYHGDKARMPSLGQAFTVLPSSHADYIQVVAIGGNVIRLLGIGGGYRATDEEIVRRLASDMGFRLVRKPSLPYTKEGT